jgi:hypothetical protein
MGAMELFEFKDFLSIVKVFCNLAAAIQVLLVELDLERKLLSITGDNASNNERMAWTSEPVEYLHDEVDDVSQASYITIQTTE